MTKMKTFLGLAVVCAGLMTGAAAQAQDNAMTSSSSTTTTTTRYFAPEQRTVVSNWIMQQNKDQCPAGTTRIKETHLMGLRDPSYKCIAPKGSTMTFYKPGTVLPSTVTYTELPSTVVTQLPPAPEGEAYVTTDNNVYLVNKQTRTVVDGVTVVGTEE